MVSLVLRYGDSDIAYKVALELKVAANRAAATTKAMQEAICMDITFISITGLQCLVSYLLDGKEDVRAVTLNAMFQWKHLLFGSEVIRYVLPQPTEAERHKLLES